MNSSIWFLFAVLTFAVVQSRRLDQGPQTFTETTPTFQKPQKRATKEVVVYLTPSQIAAIQEGRGFISAQPIEQTETSEENQEETEQIQQEPDVASELNPLESDQTQTLEVEDDEMPSSIPVEEPNTGEETEEEPRYTLVYRKTQDKKYVPYPEDKYAYLRFYPEPETQTEEAQPEQPEEAQPEQQEEAQPEQPEEVEESEGSEESKEETEEIQTEAPKQQRYKLVPYEDATEKNEATTTKAPQEAPLRERWLRLLEQNRSQLSKVQAEPETTLSKFKYLAKYNDQKQAIENEEKRKRTQLEKQKSPKIQPEVRAKNPSVPLNKEVTKNQPLAKRVKVPTPVLVPISKPSEVPQSLKSVSDQTAKVKKIGAKKPTSLVRAESENRASSPKKSSAPVERTYVLERRDKKAASGNASLRKPETITIIRQFLEK